jgi:hypothetical protein
MNEDFTFAHSKRPIQMVDMRPAPIRNVTRINWRLIVDVAILLALFGVAIYMVAN